MWPFNLPSSHVICFAQTSIPQRGKNEGFSDFKYMFCHLVTFLYDTCPLNFNILKQNSAQMLLIKGNNLLDLIKSCFTFYMERGLLLRLKRYFRIVSPLGFVSAETKTELCVHKEILS